MAFLLGIDIGTSSVKALILDGDTGNTLATLTREYPVHQPQPGYAEQNPEDWWEAVVYTVRGALAEGDIAGDAIHGVGLSGQMHGFVPIGKDHQPIRPAIIWADTRSKPQVDDLLVRIDKATMAKYAPGPPAAGFMGPTLMWLAQHELDTLTQTEAVLLPKDFIRLRLTGTIGTDPSDAAATWLFDVKSGGWSRELAEWCDVDPGILPPITASDEVAGTVTAEAAQELGITAGTPVITGCADQCAQALGYGLTEPGKALVTIGTGGQVFMALTQPQIDPHMRFYVFNHALPGRWYAAAAILSAGLSLRWLRDLFGFKDRPDAYAHLSQLANSVPPGAEGLIFLPHLAGERTPHMDPLASGVFLGLRLHHHAGHMARAVMEGVTFILHECLALVSALHTGSSPLHVIASGGATASPVWRQIQADIYNHPLTIASGANHACVGAALLAGVGCGNYGSINEAITLLPQPTEHVEPDLKNVDFYATRQGLYNEIYHQLKAQMHRLADETSVP